MSGLSLKTARAKWGMSAGARQTSLMVRRVGRALLPLNGLRLTRFLFAPPDMRTTDPTVAADIYAGQFVFAARIVSTKGLSPFDILPPTRAWAETLYGFGWLRHLHAANSVLARDNARTLVSDFVRRNRKVSAAARHPQVISRRMMAFLAQSPLVLEGADHEFYALYLDAVRQDAKALREARHVSDDPAIRLGATLALTALGLCVEGAERLERRMGRELSDQLDEQILADGGHVSRNPRVLIDLLLDLLPLRSTYAARGLDAPRGLVSAIDRIVPHLKMLRHPDGSIALFNGMGASQVDALATIFASHDASGRAATEAPYSGYQRLEAGPAIVIAETGPSPPFAASADALAGCCSFEFSHGRQRIFVNCGLPRQFGPELPVELRATAAHTATTFAETSTCQFITRAGVTRVLSGPRRVTVARSLSGDGEHLALSHDGYQSSFGVDVKRTLILSADGARLSGSDMLAAVPRSAPPGSTLTSRFHLHPSLSARVTENSDILIMPPRGPSWLMTCMGGYLQLDDSVFFAGNEGSRRTTQIVLTANDPAQPTMWIVELLPA